MSFIYLLFIKIIFNKNSRQYEKLFVAQYPKHFNSNFEHLKYGDLSTPNNSTYIITMISDGFHQSLKPNEFFSEIFKLKKNKNIKNWIFIDRSITWNDFFKSIIYFIQIKKSLNLSSMINMF